jgi:hypothetical protein
MDRHSSVSADGEEEKEGIGLGKITTLMLNLI